jgi:hypothetical protein
LSQLIQKDSRKPACSSNLLGAFGKLFDSVWLGLMWIYLPHFIHIHRQRPKGCCWPNNILDNFNWNNRARSCRVITWWKIWETWKHACCGRYLSCG